MVSLKLQKRLAASILKCGKNRVWLDPNEAAEISLSNSRANIRKLIRNGLIFKKPVAIHSRARIRKFHAAKAKGRHSGPGTRKGTKNARMPSKKLWIKRMRVLRRLLKRLRDAGKIDKHFYRELYLRVKGNVFKNKRVLLEHIYSARDERARIAQAKAEAEALKAKKAAKREALKAKKEAPAPKKEAPKKEAPAPKKEAPKKEVAKKEAPKKEAPKKEAPKKKGPMKRGRGESKQPGSSAPKKQKKQGGGRVSHRVNKKKQAQLKQRISPANRGVNRSGPKKPKSGK